MSKEFTRVVLISLGIVLLGPLLALQSGPDGYLIIVGISAFVLAMLELFLGVIFVIPKSTRNWGAGLLMTAGLLLLGSFTVCSSSAASF